MATFGLANVKKVLSANVSGKHVVGGVAAGTVAIGAVNFGLNSIKIGGIPLATKIPVSLAKVMPLLSAAIAGAIGWFALKKAQPKFANSFALGSLGAGTALTVANFLAGTKFAAGMSDYVQFRLPGMGYVVPTADGRVISAPGRMAGLADLGLLVPDTKNPRMNGLAASAMGGMGEDYEVFDVP